MNINCFSNIKNPVYSDGTGASVDIVCDIAGVGENIGFTATSIDCEEYGRQLYQNAINGDYGDIGEYVAPVEVESAAPLKSTRKTIQELSLDAFALQCAADAGTASDEQLETLAGLKNTIAERIGENKGEINE